MLRKNLQAVATTDGPPGLAEKAATIQFQPSMFWELLEPNFFQSAQLHATNPDTATSRVEHRPDARMRVTTHFVHPLVESQAEQPSLPDNIANSTDSIFPSLEEMEQFPMDEVLGHFASGDLDWLQP